jgi:RNA polymerase sigma-70 factor (ECF subfamily)
MTKTGKKLIRHYQGTQRRDVNLEQQFGRDIDRSAAVVGNLAAPGSSPSHRAARREAAVVLADKLMELPEHYRQAIVLHHCQGYSIAEVADLIGRTHAATNSLIARAVVKLRSLMKDTT